MFFNYTFAFIWLRFFRNKFRALLVAKAVALSLLVLVMLAIHSIFTKSLPERVVRKPNFAGDHIHSCRV